MRVALLLLFFLILWLIPSQSYAQKGEITNREVVERLTRLEEGQKALAQRLEEVNATSARYGGRPLPSTTVPFLMTTS
jgi:hypothetical protein